MVDEKIWPMMDPALRSSDPPRVSVLMPVYNCAPFVEQAVRSILDQTFTDLELIVVDDRSTDGTLEIVRAVKDPRLRVVAKEENTGLTNSLNLAIDLARGEYLARMDGDDISLPHRLARQVALMDTEPGLVLCSCWHVTIPDGRLVKKPVAHEDILFALLEYNAILHPGVLMRRQLPDGTVIRYPVGMEPAEDMLLWSRLIVRGRFANIPEPLVQYRHHAGQVSRVRREAQVVLRSRVRAALWSAVFGVELKDEGLYDLFVVAARGDDAVGSFLAALDALDRTMAGAANTGFDLGRVYDTVRRRRSGLIRRFIAVPGLASFGTLRRIAPRLKLIHNELGSALYLRFLAKCFLPNVKRIPPPQDKLRHLPQVSLEMD